MVVATGDVRLPRLRRRDAQSELDRLYRKHGDEVLRYARLVLRSQADAEDVTQTAFMRALRALERGEKVQKPRNWLIKIAHNECSRVLQTRRRRQVEVELEDVPVEPAETGRAEELRRALTHLAPNQREALVLRELEGRSYAEIATVLGLSESAVETLIFRARRAVREQLEETVGCDEAATLLEADVLSLDERRRLRAHTRACADCASLERRARGRKSALRRIASSIGLPWWGGKAALVALSVGAAATTIGVAVANPHPHTFPVTNIAPAHVDRPLAPVPLAAHRRAAHAARHTAEKHAAVVTHKVSATVKVSDTRSVARGGGHSPAGVVDEAPDSQPAAVEPSAPTTPQTPVNPAAPAPKPAQPVTVTPPTVTVPSVTVTTPVATVTTPTVTTPTVTVTVPQVTPPPLPHLGP